MTPLMRKLLHIPEGAILLLTFAAQPFFGVVFSIVATIYYVAMFKVNIVNKYHAGSWCTYFQNLLTKTKTK